MLKQPSEALVAPSSIARTPSGIRLPLPRWLLAPSPAVVALLLVGSPVAARALGGDWLVGVGVWCLAWLLWFVNECRTARATCECPGSGGSDAQSSHPGRYAATAALFAGSFFAMAWIAQPIIHLNGGLAWDGRNYFGMYGAFKGYAHGDVPAPYGQRIGLPLLATFLHEHADRNFLAWTMAFWIAGIGAWAYSLRAHFHLSGVWVAAAVAWVCLAFSSPTRSAPFTPFSVEAPAIAFVAVFTLLAHARRLTAGGRFAFCVCAGLAAALFKESAVMWAAFGWVGCVVSAWLAFDQVFRVPAGLASPARIGWLARGASALVAPRALPWLGLTLGAAAGLALAQIPFGVRAGALNVTILAFWAERRLSHPMDALRIVGAWGLGLAPFVVLALSVAWRRAANALRENRGAETLRPSPAVDAAPRSLVDRRGLWIALALWAVVSACSGSDLTRFAFSAFPLAVPLIVRAVGDQRALAALASLLLALPLARPWQTIPSPDIVFDAIPSGQNWHGLYAWTAEYANPGLVALWCAYLLAAGGVLAWLRRRHDRS
ncbi:hypothetical protein [Burkholderia pseudomallei]|uniref:hypothetical protein n=1 Tax=Burkholderia pseudomallei TaxID=28450 RepID=UPI0011C4E191|nr:hypothetical protein [Burkholderia pseudomallei]